MFMIKKLTFILAIVTLIFSQQSLAMPRTSAAAEGEESETQAMLEHILERLENIERRLHASTNRSNPADFSCIDHMPESITLSCEMFIKQRPIHINLEAITDTHSAGLVFLQYHPVFMGQNHHLGCGVERVIFKHTGSGHYVIDGQTEQLKGPATQTFHLDSAPLLPTFYKMFPPVYQGMITLDMDFVGGGHFRNLSLNGATDALRLYSLGGRYEPGVSLAEIEPYFVSAFYSREKTYPYIWSQSEIFASSGFQAPNDLKLDRGRYHVSFNEQGPEIWYRSVAESISQGDFKLAIRDASNQKHTYRSADFKETSATTVDITFVLLDSYQEDD